MISYLKGQVQFKNKDYIVINVNNVGYQVLTLKKNLEKFFTEQEVEFFIYTHVREDQLTLFGVSTLEELDMFESLMSVSGIGPKSALNILNGLNVNQITQAIQKAKVEEFKKITGIGNKVAQKIIVELQGKIGKVSDLKFEEAQDSELVQALVNLGFSKKESMDMSVNIDTNLEINEKVKLALKKNKV